MTGRQDFAVNGPGRLLEDLNPAQREAVEATTGPLVILAGAGTGKTRAISRRAAYAIETGAVPADQILLVTFTEKAAREMAERMAALGHPRVMARTFHSAALAQLRHFWPLRHGEPLPATLDSKARLLAPMVRALRPPYKFTPTRDVADIIEWAKVRRIPPDCWEEEGGDRSSLPPDVFAGLYAGYERAKTRAGLLDFEDMLVRTVDLLETDAESADLVRRRKTWFSVDEYQDTNPLAERLLELWAGDSRDIAVVGDPDQTIYTFTGATPEFLLGFEARHPGARRVVLRDNYRSTPRVLALANRLMEHPPDRALRAVRPDGPSPSVGGFTDGETEAAGLVASVRRLLAAGVAAPEIAVLVRVNAQLPALEDALRRAGVAFTLRGQRFYERPEVRDARRLLARRRAGLAKHRGPELVEAVRALLGEELGLGVTVAADLADGAEAREREASLELLLSILADLAAANENLTIDDATSELDRRAEGEAADGTDGVNLLTYHRAKGLEWDAVFLPALEEGLLPIRQAKEDGSIAEERRLLYVGITRARTHLWLSWAERRIGPNGKETTRWPSRFLDDLQPRIAGRGAGLGARVPKPVRPAGTVGAKREPIVVRDVGAFEALKTWRRTRAAADAVPAYVVCHDSTLAAIADARPLSLPALRRVNGMGPTKLERYGEEILAVLRTIRP